MSHVFGSRPKAAETEAENATKKVPGRLNWWSPKKDYFLNWWSQKYHLSQFMRPKNISVSLQLWSVLIGMSVRSPNMKSNCLPCLRESSRYLIASPTITYEKTVTMTMTMMLSPRVFNRFSQNHFNDTGQFHIVPGALIFNCSQFSTIPNNDKIGRKSF